MAKLEQKSEQKLEHELQMIRTNAAGIDLGSKMHYAAVSKLKVTEGENSVESFSADLEGVREMSKWLKSHGVESIAMEATGIYWLSVYEYLEQEGFDVCLVHAQHVKQVAGRKSDVSDSQWIQQLHSYGLLSHAFVPADKIRELRCYVRHRRNLEQDKSESMLKMHKALDMMNVKIHHCLSDMSGVLGMKILRLIASGETDASVLASHHMKQLKSSKEAFRRSLEGNYRAEHVFMLQQNLAQFDFLAVQILESDVMIERVLSYLTEGELPPCDENDNTEQANNTSNASLIRPKESYFRKNQYSFNLKWYLNTMTGIDLTAIDGLDEIGVMAIISETGLDYTKWQSSQHFTSWLCLAAKPKITGGKKVGHFRPKTTNRATQAFRWAAQAVRNTKSALGAFYRKLKGRKGPAIAIKATARKIATIFYKMMSEKVEYNKVTDEEYQANYQEKQLNRLMQQATKLGFSLQKTENLALEVG